MYKLTEDRTKKGKELRSVFVDTLLKLMATDENIVALDGDLGGASKFTEIAKTYSDRFIQCGISEANMVGVSAECQRLGLNRLCTHLDLLRQDAYMIRFIYPVLMPEIRSILWF